MDAQQIVVKFLDANSDLLKDENVQRSIKHLTTSTFRGLLQILSAVGKDNPHVSAFISTLTTAQAQKLVQASLGEFNSQEEKMDRETLIKILIEKMQDHRFGLTTKSQVMAAQKIIPLLIDNLLSGNNPSLTKCEIGRRIEFSDYHVDQVLRALSSVLRDEEISIGGKKIDSERNRLIFVKEDNE